jgi:hypothetical protein
MSTVRRPATLFTEPILVVAVGALDDLHGVGVGGKTAMLALQAAELGTCEALRTSTCE